MSASEQRLYFLLQTTAHLLKKQTDAACVKAGGLTTAQAAVLAIVNDQGPITQNRVASQLSQRESAMTKMTARLEKSGFITKVKSDKDARAWSLKATRAGEQALHNVKPAFMETNAIFDATLGDNKVIQLATDLKLLLNHLNQ